MTARRPGPEESKRAVLMATAAWRELDGLTQLYQAAVMRNDEAEIERIRLRCHDLIDVCLDNHGIAAMAMRKMLGD